MKTLLIALIGCSLLTGGCASYPRYRTQGSATPEQGKPDDHYISTSQFIDFGLILQSYLGKPYRGQSSHDPGLDCSAFVQEVFLEFNRTSLPRTVAEQYKMGNSIPTHRLRLGDLLFFKTERNKVSHVGISVGYGDFIHASSSRGVIISDMSEEYWASRFAGARRIFDLSGE